MFHNPKPPTFFERKKSTIQQVLNRITDANRLTEAFQSDLVNANRVSPLTLDTERRRIHTEDVMLNLNQVPPGIQYSPSSLIFEKTTCSIPCIGEVDLIRKALDGTDSRFVDSNQQEISIKTYTSKAHPNRE